MSWTTTQSKEIFAETPMPIGLSNGSKILRQRPIWVTYGSARYGLSDQFCLLCWGNTATPSTMSPLEPCWLRWNASSTVGHSLSQQAIPRIWIHSHLPNHILTMKSRVVMPPPGNFQKADLYLRKRWKRVQYLSNVFWSRWRKEYVQNLQQRVKWNCPQRNFEKRDLVLIVDDRAPRNDWNMARVVDVHPDSNDKSDRSELPRLRRP